MVSMVFTLTRPSLIACQKHCTGEFVYLAGTSMISTLIFFRDN